MEYKGYLAHVTFDAQANLFHGEVVNIRDKDVAQWVIETLEQATGPTGH